MEFSLPHQRSSNLELFRIIAMLAIVCHHFVVNSGLTAPDGPILANPMSLRSQFLLLMGAWGKIGINCFVLITGYFMCKKEITAQKFIKLISQVYFYKIVIFILLAFAGYQTVNVVSLIQLILPVTSVAQNFVACFLIFFLCIPFLNILIRNLTQKQHRNLLILLIVPFVLLGSVPKFYVMFNYVTWFCILYLISSYVRLYSRPFFENAKIWGGVTLISFVLAVASIPIFTWLPTLVNKPPMPYFLVADSNKFLALAVGFSSFMLFKNIHIPQSKIINTIAATTFGVLLIHANSDAMRTWLWKNMIDCVGHYNAEYMPLYVIGSVAVIFAICSLIDFIRIKLIEKPYMPFIDQKIQCRKNP